MKYVIAAGAVVLCCLATATTGGAGGKKKDPADQLPPRADEVPKYLKMLGSTSPKDRALAVQKIGLRGKVNAADVKDALGKLKDFLEKDADPGVRKEAALALGNISPDAEDTVPRLARTVKEDKVLDVRLAATVALGQYGPEAKPALPALRSFAGEITDKKSPQAQTIAATIKRINAVQK